MLTLTSAALLASWTVVSLTLMSLAAVGGGSGTILLTAFEAPYAQTFDTLASSGTSGSLPDGWFLFENGSSTRNDGLYTAGTGSSNTGDTYSFGTADATSGDRAFGTLQSGTLIPVIGASLTNGTGAVLTRLGVTYTGEQWRLGATDRTDRLDFQYSLDAEGPTSGTWTNVDALGFSTPFTTATGFGMGNQPTHRQTLSFTISGLSIPNGARFWIRWVDVDIAGNEDGLAVDDFTIVALPPVTTSPTAIGTATPSNVMPGDPLLLTVAVTPGSTPTSTGLRVFVNLSSFGLSQSQMFFDDGSNGDRTAGDNVFSFLIMTGEGTPPGPQSLLVKVIDDQQRRAVTTISLNVLVPLPITPIHDIQGPGTRSPLFGRVRTGGIITGIKLGSGFFLQALPGEYDADPNTSEGIFVFTASTPAVEIGSLARVVGTVQEFVPSQDRASPPVTEIGFVSTLAILSTGHMLPDAVTLTAADTSPSGTIEQLERYESMRVHVEDLTVVAPTDGNISEANARASSTGVFFGVITGVARPFREPGIAALDPLPPGAPATVPRFDGNPERLRVDSDAQPGTADIDVAAGARVFDVIGPLDFAFRTYTILPDRATPPTVVDPIAAIPVPTPSEEEFTIASFNMERFYDTTNDPGISDVALTPQAFANRLNKASLTIRTVLGLPDILGVIEVENLATLQAIANKVNADAGAANPAYVAYLKEGNDVGGIDVGFLVKSSRVMVVGGDVEQIGKDVLFTGPGDFLNDRPSLVLNAVVTLPGGPSAVTVIVNHLRSLLGIDDPVDGHRVRTKRKLQADFLAAYVQSRQAANPNEAIVLVGDFNAFPFNDGYVDVIGAIKGAPAPPAQVTLANADVVNPDLMNLVDVVPPSDRYSFVFDGSAQVLDHILVTANLVSRVSGIQFAHANADFPETDRNDPLRPERITDHDLPIVYLRR